VGDTTHGHKIIGWWLSGDGRWHEGTPPAGWTQAEDRRWYPTEPPSTAVGYASKSESIAGPPATVIYEDPEDWYDAEDPGQGDWDGTGRYYSDGEAEDDVEDRGGRWSTRAGVAVALAVLAAVIATLGIVIGSGGGSDDQSAPYATTTAISIMPTSVPGGDGAPAPEEAATSSTTDRADRAGAPPVSTPPTPTTTVGSPPEPAPPPATSPPRSRPPGSIRPGAPCETVGATAVTANGTPVTCATAGCEGDPFDEPRWRLTVC
jgi:hypothetical protein